MKKLVDIGGPWRGSAPSVSPQMLSQGFVHEAENVHFFNGRMHSVPGLVALGSMPLCNGTPIGSVQKVLVLPSRNGTEQMLFITNSNVYVGDRQVVYDITGDSNWSMGSAANLSFTYIVTDISEWILLIPFPYNAMYRWEVDRGNLERWQYSVEMGRMSLISAEMATIFDNRLFFIRPYFPLYETTHGVAWFGVNGPFDDTFPTAGVSPLVDLPGPVYAYEHMADYMVLFKAGGLFLVQKTYDAQFPFVFHRRSVGVGSLYKHSTVRIMDGRGVGFLGTDLQYYVFNGEQSVAVSGPVRDEFQKRDPYTLQVVHDDKMGLVRFVYPDLTLVWSPTEQWWSMEPGINGLISALPRYIEAVAGRVMDLPEEPVSNLPAVPVSYFPTATLVESLGLVTDNGFVGYDEKQWMRGKITSGEFRFPRPITVTRLIARIRSPYGGTVSFRHFDGQEWSDYQTTSLDDNWTISRIHYDFVCTTEQLQFEMSFDGRGFILEDAVLELASSQLQDEVPVAFGDYQPVSWTGVNNGES